MFSHQMLMALNDDKRRDCEQKGAFERMLNNQPGFKSLICARLSSLLLGLGRQLAGLAGALSPAENDRSIILPDENSRDWRLLFENPSPSNFFA